MSAVSVSGAVTVRDAARGEVICKSTSGNVAVGVRKGTLVWLDLTTVSGRTTSGLSPDEAPERPRGDPHGEGADGERQHHDQPERRRRRGRLRATAPGGSTTVASRPLRRS